jgi:hypothetical protein
MNRFTAFDTTSIEIGERSHRVMLDPKVSGVPWTVKTIGRMIQYTYNSVMQTFNAKIALMGPNVMQAHNWISNTVCKCDTVVSNGVVVDVSIPIKCVRFKFAKNKPHETVVMNTPLDVHVSAYFEVVTIDGVASLQLLFDTHPKPHEFKKCVKHWISVRKNTCVSAAPQIMPNAYVTQREAMVPSPIPMSDTLGYIGLESNEAGSGTGLDRTWLDFLSSESCNATPFDLYAGTDHDLLK